MSTAADLHTGVHVRPAWGPGAPELSERALTLLVAEWRELGLLPDDEEETDPVALLRGIQQRSTLVADRASPTTGPPLRLVTTADTADAAPEAEWSELEGTLLTFGETALIGRDETGHDVRERFRRGSVMMPVEGTALLNRGHDRARTIGHLTSVTTEGEEVRLRARVVDSIEDGYTAVQLCRAGSISSLSIEFVSLGRPHTTITREADGGKLVEHSKVMLVGAALVSQPAYRSARVTRLLDRVEAGRQREHDRQEAMRRLAALSA